MYVYLKREDLYHPTISGNKYRKLKYNISTAKAQRHTTLLTFGGAYSNHIEAVATAGKEKGFETVGIIRGEELATQTAISENPTLLIAQSRGMKLQFVSREAYRHKDEDAFLNKLSQQYDYPYILPEGGTNALAVKGCEEILTVEDEDFDIICCSAGTGGTASGIINSLSAHQNALIFSALKGDFLNEAIRHWTSQTFNWELVTGYHFGGYARCPKALIDFINIFVKTYKTPLDPIYTGKMMYGIFDRIDRGLFPPKTRILAIHTGGLQGIAGMNKRLEKKGLPNIEC